MSTQAQTIDDNFDSNISPADYDYQAPDPDELKLVLCDMCPESAFNTREVLGQAGWLLFTGSALCPQHGF
jgi:hypothetical protein